MEADTGEDRQLGLPRLHWGRQELVVAGVNLDHSAVHLVSEVLAVRLPVTPEEEEEIFNLLGSELVPVSPSLQVNTESVIAGELMTRTGGQREHLAVGSCSQGDGKSLIKV